MRRRMDVDDLAVARGDQRVAERVDGDPLTDHLLGENGIGDLLDRHEYPGDRRHQGNAGDRRS